MADLMLRREGMQQLTARDRRRYRALRLGRRPRSSRRSIACRNHERAVPDFEATTQAGEIVRIEVSRIVFDREMQQDRCLESIARDANEPHPWPTMMSARFTIP
jgi:hypothetical protein